MKTDGSVYDVIVLGGGAAGMMAAATAAQRGKRVLLLEKNKKLGEKLSITGGGRCNITNAEEDEKILLAEYGDSAPFLFSAFSQLGVQDTFSFFESIGVPLLVEARKRAFPKSQKASDVTHALIDLLKSSGVSVVRGCAATEVRKKGAVVTGVVAGGVLYEAESYIFATGGVSHPETGSTGDGFVWLRSLGHNVAKPTPTIVPLRTREEWGHALAGKTLTDVKVTFFVSKARRLSLKGNVLLTHFGISGPLILNAAGRVADLLHEGEVTATIDTHPLKDLGVLDKHMAAVFDAHKNKSLRNVFRQIAPTGTSDVILTLVPSIDPNKKIHSVTKDERRLLAHTLKHLPLTITGLMGLNRAVVADGGIPLTEIDTRTMRSKVYGNVFVIGDLLHIRRPTGGYSLQLCWTTGFVAGKHA